MDFTEQSSYGFLLTQHSAIVGTLWVPVAHARQVVTALAELRRQNKRVFVTSMCVGTVSDDLAHRHQVSPVNSFLLAGHGHGWYLCLGAIIIKRF